MREDWFPFDNRVQFEFADLIYRRNQMPQTQITDLLEIWAASMMLAHDGLSESDSPFANAKDMLASVDSIQVGDAPWQSFACMPSANLPDNAPEWMSKEYEVWYRDIDKMLQNLISNPDFANEFDFVPYVEVDKDNNRRFGDFFSGDWVWTQAVCALSSLYLCISDIISPRTKSARTQKTRARCSYQSSLETTRPLCPLQQDNRTSTPCICR